MQQGVASTQQAVSSAAPRPNARQRRLGPRRCSPGEGWHSRVQQPRPSVHAAVAFRELNSFLGLGTTKPKPSQPQQPQAEPRPPQQVKQVQPQSNPKAAARRDFLEARQVSLFQLFDGREFMFDIPYYQRPYSWGVKQVHEMLQDFLAAYYARKEYFLGALITVRTEDNCLQVIDGQQRLTSLMLLLACVLDWARESGSTVLEQRLHHMLFIEADPLDPRSQGRLRLRLRDGDDQFFERNMMHAFLPTRFKYTGVGSYLTPSNSSLMDAAAHQPHYGHATALSNGVYSAAAGAKASGLAGVHYHAPPSAVSVVSAQVGGGGPTWNPAQAAAAQKVLVDSDWHPLENESWWRMYQNAAHMCAVLRPGVASGQLNLQELLFHVLRNCHCVLMNARDEATSMRIFSTINSRGMDLTMVDKLKADLLEVLPHEQCVSLAGSWAEMEDVLGRTAFHRVFDYMRTLACAMRPEVQHLSVLEYFGAQRREPSLAAATIQCALHYGRLLLQLRQCRFQVWPPAPPPVPFPFPAHVDSQLLATQQQLAPSGPHPTRAKSATPREASRAPSSGPGAASKSSSVGRGSLLSDDGHGGIVAVFDAGGPDSQVHTQGAVRELERQARHMALFEDEAWLPATLEFFAQEDDLDARTRFLQGAEVLQLYLELCCDAATAAARWQEVAAVVLKQQPAALAAAQSRSQPGAASAAAAAAVGVDLQAIYAVLALTPQEKYTFRAKLDQRDLYAFAPRRALAHLLLRAEGAAVSTSPSLDFTALHVEQIAPPHPPKDSAWRRQKLGSPGRGSPGSAGSAEAEGSADNGSSNGNGVPSSSAGSSNGSRAGSSGSSGGASGAVRGARRRSPSSNGASGSEGVKYWYEPQRLQWHSKLGNLVLLPTTSTSQRAVANADFETKVAYFKSCGVETLLPEWSGTVVSGCYSRHKFSCEECKQRHEGLVNRLIQVFKLADDEDFDDLWEEGEEDYNEDSVY